MTVNSAQQEETIRKAERQIRERLKLFEERYAVTDVRDLLSMCVLQFATEAQNNESELGSMQDDIAERLKALEHALDATLDR